MQVFVQVSPENGVMIWRPLLYLLEDRSYQGKTYHLTWVLQQDEIELLGNYLEQRNELFGLSDETFFAISASFSSAHDGSDAEIYEYRYFLQDNTAGMLRMLIPPESFYSSRFPNAPWVRRDISSVITMLNDE